MSKLLHKYQIYTYGKMINIFESTQELKYISYRKTKARYKSKIKDIFQRSKSLDLLVLYSMHSKEDKSSKLFGYRYSFILRNIARIA